jgi:undecaprenyl diphosphate synthase
VGAPEKLPRHVGVIMDGNGRWAEARGLPRIEGHRRGAERAREIIRAASGMGIEALTLYTFSLENWQRPKKEVSVLMKLLEHYLRADVREMKANNIVFRAIGDRWRLPDGVQSLIRKTEEETAGNTGMALMAALSYGGRDEIVRAVRKALASGAAPEEMAEVSFAALLDTAGLPDVDLIIRTSGEMRLSNFLLWQSAYAEFYFASTLWPDFTAEEFRGAIDEYMTRERRFGAVHVKEP